MLGARLMFAGLVLMLGTQPAGATSWQVLGESKTAQVWVDVDSIKVQGARMEATMFTSYDKLQSFGGAEGITAIRYKATLAHALFSCAEKTHALSKLRFFADADASSKAIAAYDYDEPRWRSISAGSNVAAVFAFVCSRRTR